jgi:hypothetical protein
MMRKGTLLLLPALIALQISTAFAGDGPSVKGELKDNIKSSMKAFIDRNTLDNSFVIYDPVAGELKKLQFQELHDGIAHKGDFYVSCADFNDSNGKLYDIDFLVVEDGLSVKTVEAVVHAADGNKRKYHLEN